MPITLPCRSVGAVTFILGLTLAGCGGGKQDATADSAGPSATVGATAAGGDAEVAFAFTDADLDAYIRGMRKEVELVKAAKERGAAAKTPEERGAAAQAEFDVINEGLRRAEPGLHWGASRTGSAPGGSGSNPRSVSTLHGGLA